MYKPANMNDHHSQAPRTARQDSSSRPISPVSRDRNLYLIHFYFTPESDVVLSHLLGKETPKDTLFYFLEPYTGTFHNKTWCKQYLIRKLCLSISFYFRCTLPCTHTGYGLLHIWQVAVKDGNAPQKSMFLCLWRLVVPVMISSLQWVCGRWTNVSLPLLEGRWSFRGLELDSSSCSWINPTVPHLKWWGVAPGS